MCGIPCRAGLVLALVALLVVAVALPGQAAYTKLYLMQNNTGSNQSSLQAVTNGLESIIAQYSYHPQWLPASVGYAVVGGLY